MDRAVALEAAGQVAVLGPALLRREAIVLVAHRLLPAHPGRARLLRQELDVRMAVGAREAVGA
ncbi:MAG: hypothetical protein L0214_11280, partial [candidate division NC10 bacterium]|nr:hypothetical protein [candidate division NC10 bacterium]